MRVRYRYSTVDWEEPVLGWLSTLRRGRRRRQSERRFCMRGSQVNFLYEGNLFFEKLWNIYEKKFKAIFVKICVKCVESLREI